MIIKQIVWILALLLVVAGVSAVQNPEIYWGYVYVEGELVPDGSLLTVESESGELFASETVPSDSSFPGSFSISITFDDKNTEIDEGADVDESLIWKVNGTQVLAPAADIAESGNTNNNVVVNAVFTPVLSASVQHSDASLALGESLDVSIVLDNAGLGSANVVVLELEGALSLPRTIYVGKNSFNQTEFSIISSVCGAHTQNLALEYYDLGDNPAGSFNKELNYNVTGPDLVLDSVTISNETPELGKSISVVTSVTNEGALNSSGFTAYFYNDEILFHTLTYAEVMKPNDTLGISGNVLAEFGEHTIKVVVEALSAECSVENNEGMVSLDASNPPPPTPVVVEEVKEVKEDEIEAEVQTVQEIVETTDDEAMTPAVEPLEHITGFVPFIDRYTGIVTDTKASLTFLLLLVVCALIIYVTIWRKKGEGVVQHPSQEIFSKSVDKYVKKHRTDEKKQEVPSKAPQKAPSMNNRVQIQKTIKISSKKEVIDRLKEVFDKDDSR